MTRSGGSGFWQRQFAWLTTRFDDRSLLWNSLTLMSGSLAGQALVFLSSPAIARMFDLAAFGDLANFGAWAAIFALLSNLRYEHAILVARDDEEMYGMMSLTAVLSIGSVGLLGLLALALHQFHDGGGFLAELRRIAWLIPPGVLAITATSLFTQHQVRTGRFRRLTMVLAAQSAVTVVAQILLGALSVPHALILGSIAGFAFSAVALARHFLVEHGLQPLLRNATRDRLLRNAKLHFNFPKYTLAADGVGLVVQRFLPVLVLAWFNPAVAGLYAFSVRIVRTPLLMLAHPMVGALRKAAGDQVRAGGSLAPLFRSTVRGLFLASLLPFGVLALFAEPTFLFVFGEQWSEAGRMVQILSPGILLEFVAIPTAVFFLATDTQHIALALQVFGFAALVVALSAGRLIFDDFVSTCYVLSAAMILVHGVGLLLARSVASRGPRASVTHDAAHVGA